MIDIQNDELLTMNEAVQRVPGRPHVSTIFRWTAGGKLDSIRVGGKRFTSVEAIGRFIAKCSGHKPDSQPTRQRTKQLASAERELAADGI